MNGASAFRIAAAVACALAGWQIGSAVPRHPAQPRDALIGIIIGAVAGAFAVPWIIKRPHLAVKHWVQTVPLSDLLACAVGALIGIAAGALLAYPLSFLPWWFGRIVPTVAAVGLAYVGAMLALSRQWDLTHRLGSPPPPANPIGSDRAESIIVDTSAIIDGRIADITQTGFLHGTLLIPRFVLRELQHIADSPDPLRRNRGRRGLDILGRLQKDQEVPVEICDVDAPDVVDVDGKLVKLARQFGSPVMTNDFNLNRVAALQGVRVLNINQLANALKPIVLPGEEMCVRIIQEGKEYNQGVAYLDDGTMIVVENGRHYLDKDVDVIVTRVLQTVAGRMIFAHPKQEVRQ